MVLAGLAAAKADAAGRGEVWLVSTRSAPRSGRLTSTDKIRYWHFQADNRWLPADGNDLLDDDRPVPTTVFIHGNRTSADAALRSGWCVYRQMRREAADRPFRLVIWSWPSERIRGRIRKDVCVKASYSDVQAYYLADCLCRVKAEVPVSLVGYSFGARVITGALHLLAGGQVAGRRIPQPDSQQHPPSSIRAVLVAAALDADWLRPGHRNGLALSQVDRMLVVRNRRDPVLKWYPLLCGRRGPKAMGYCGPTGCQNSPKLEVLNLTRSVGRNHDLPSYMGNSALDRRFARYTFLDAHDTHSIAEKPSFPELPPKDK